jgi:hypothetical protein
MALLGLPPQRFVIYPRPLLPEVRLWRTKSEYDIFASMPVRSCKVTIIDIEGVGHSVEVTASSLYEATALGLKAIRGHPWIKGISERFNSVKIEVKDIAVEHAVKLKEFHRMVGSERKQP